MQTQNKLFSNSPAAAFEQAVANGRAKCPTARLLQRLDAGEVEMKHYHAILCCLFHQTYSGPYTFARAAVNCNWRHEVAKEYLLRHAEEERIHWRWVLDDLKSTGYTGPDVRRAPPHHTTQAYVGLNYFIAEHTPIARLATAAVLEGIGAAHGGIYGRKIVQQLDLKKSQASFFLSHAETDIAHTAELNDVLAASELNQDDWIWMVHAAETAGRFYRAIYDHEDFA
jgi:hypothetical protein